MFVDFAKIEIASGKGGDGSVAFRREKFVPKGGPAGGNGGRGGDVIFEANENLATLLDFKYSRKYEAEDGQEGGTSLKDGKNGKSVTIQVPVGTVIKDAETDVILFDLDEHQKTFVAARGGRGGKGNSNFATSTNQAPRFAEDGKPGQSLTVVLELKLIADVGLVGFPNAGKSTFISSVSAAKPKIADYPFTTLVPNLGIVNYHNYNSFTIADIPGIIEGAHEGKGLGLRFLRHIERTRSLLIMIDVNSEDIQSEYDTLLNELEKYSDILRGKEHLVAITKLDTADEEKKAEIKNLKIKGYDKPVYKISSVAHLNLDKIIDALWEMIHQ